MAISFPDEDEIRVMPSSTPSTIIGRVRTCRSVTVIEWVTIGVTLLSILLGVGASIYRFATLYSDDPDIVYSILILLNLCLSCFYVFHGIFQEQPFEMVTLVFTLLLVWILIMVNYLSGLVQYKMILFIISSVLMLPNIALALVVGWNYWESGNLIFKTVGSDIKFQQFCRQLFFVYSLLIFDVQAQLSCLVLTLQQGFSYVHPNEITIIVFGFIYTFVWVSIGYSAVRNENGRLTWVFLLSSAVQPIYVVFLFTKAIDVIGFDKKYSVLNVAVYISTISLLLTHFTLIAMIFIVTQNYGKGLKFKVYGVGQAMPTRITETDSLLHTSSSADDILPAP